jgi:hypothetical protein
MMPQAPCDGDVHLRHIGREFGGDVLEHEDEDEEIEGVARPTEIARHDDIALLGGQVAQIAQRVGKGLVVSRSAAAGIIPPARMRFRAPRSRRGFNLAHVPPH